MLQVQKRLCVYMSKVRTASGSGTGHSHATSKDDISLSKEEAALRKHGREGLLLRGVVRAQGCFLLSSTPYYHLVPVLPENSKDQRGMRGRETGEDDGTLEPGHIGTQKLTRHTQPAGLPHIPTSQVSVRH